LHPDLLKLNIDALSGRGVLVSLPSGLIRVVIDGWVTGLVIRARPRMAVASPCTLRRRDCSQR
jgi:hypothetical protein